MIKNGDLKPKNIVHYVCDETEELLKCVIDWQDIKMLETNEVLFNNLHKPIPLTEEILLKCGFKKHLDTIFIHWSKEGGMFEISTRLPYGSFGLWVNGTLGCFQYVHQLQNLYFALTNEELQINL